MIGSVADQCWMLDCPKAPGASSPAQKLVLLAYAAHANVDGRGIYPGMTRIVERTGLSEFTVRRALRVLEERGVLIREVEPTPRKSTEWRLGDWYIPSPTWRPARGSTVHPQGLHGGRRGGSTVHPEVKALKGSLKNGDFAQIDESRADPVRAREALEGIKAELLARKRSRAATRAAPPKPKAAEK